MVDGQERPESKVKMGGAKTTKKTQQNNNNNRKGIPVEKWRKGGVAPFNKETLPVGLL